MPTASPAYPVVSVADQTMGSPPLAEIAVTAMQLPEPHSHGTLREVQLADPLLGPLLLGKEEGKKPPLPATDKSSRRLLQIWDQLLVKDGVLFRYLQPVDGALGVLQTVVPVALRQGILRDLHGGGSRWTPRGRQDTQPVAGAILLAWVLQ